MTVLGVGLVAMMFVLLVGFISGLKRTLINTGGAQNWIVMSRAVSPLEGAVMPVSLLLQMAQTALRPAPPTPELFRTCPTESADRQAADPEHHRGLSDRVPSG